MWQAEKGREIHTILVLGNMKDGDRL